MATSRWRLLLALLSVTLFASGTTLAAPSDKPPFYRVQWQGKSAYLLGSIHIGRADFYPMPAQVEAAFTKSKGLVVEIDMNKVDSRALLQKYGGANSAQGFDWQSRDKQTVATMSQYCEGKASLCQSLQAFAPWLQAAQLNLLRYNGLGFSTDYGVDMQLLSRGGKPVYELETAESQFQLLASFDSQVQWAMVREAIDASDAELLSLVDAWRSGNETALDTLMQEQLGGEGDPLMLDKILWQRNKVMADGMIKLMGSETANEPLFVVVGAGHVVGDKSVVQLLKQQGATVTACWQARCD
ncbi:TraB/GumN family protein [Shewanella xiamenensis]|uniref:TraB/GumN family protein n=1 Tax=Shewanella xiamenensis TaxID=332186 RepID=UPI0024AD2B54|nr:TraB/GumN family protein [Shewanella xiamenensis]WHF56160.1 TraB/GumN family protein [Shewanella xiamenensis]